MTNPTVHEFRDGYIRAEAHPGECVIIEANDAETGDDAEVCLDMDEARAFHTWLGRLLGVHEPKADALSCPTCKRPFEQVQVGELRGYFAKPPDRPCSCIGHCAMKSKHGGLLAAGVYCVAENREGSQK